MSTAARVMAVIGNPNPGGRTTATARAVAERVAGMVGVEAEVAELAPIGPALFSRDAPDVVGLRDRVRTAQAVVFASPTFKASISGLLKAFLDRFDEPGLAGVVAIPVMLGAGWQHALAPELHLRPVLVELGAIVPTRAFYMLDSEMGRLDERVGTWWEQAAPVLAKLLGA